MTSSKKKSESITKAPSRLNPDFDKNHLVKDCEDTSEELKKTLLEAHRANKKKDSEKARVSVLLSAPTSTSAPAPTASRAGFYVHKPSVVLSYI